MQMAPQLILSRLFSPQGRLINYELPSITTLLQVFLLFTCKLYHRYSNDDHKSMFLCVYNLCAFLGQCTGNHFARARYAPGIYGELVREVAGSSNEAGGHFPFV